MNPFSKIYIAGHTGLVGSAILRCLQSQGYKNFILRTHQELDLEIQKDVNDFFETERPEYVFLAAAKVGGIYANNTYPADFIYNNLVIETNVIHASYKYRVKKLLFLGSSCIYPRLAPQPMKEEYLLTGELEPTNEPYAIAKIAGIKLCQSFNRQYGTNFISVMPTNLYGPNDNYDPMNSHVLPALIRRFHEAEIQNLPFVEVWGTGADRQKEGKFELAQEGTLFLDEITNLPEAAQTKLLRVLQEKKIQRLGGKKDIKVDVRIIVATNIPLFYAVKKGKFREDLFYRLNEFEIIIPTLRERKEDIPILAKRFLDEANNEFGKNIKGFTPQAMESLLTYRWPGNVREFKNAIRKTALLTNSKNIGLIYFSNDDLNTPEKPEFNEVSGEGSSLHDLVRDTTNEMERDIIIKTLSKVGGNKSKAARLLKIDRMTLYAKLKRFDIK
jgi:hypothetical protein